MRVRTGTWQWKIVINDWSGDGDDDDMSVLSLQCNVVKRLR